VNNTSCKCNDCVRYPKLPHRSTRPLSRTSKDGVGLHVTCKFAHDNPIPLTWFAMSCHATIKGIKASMCGARIRLPKRESSRLMSNLWLGAWSVLGHGRSPNNCCWNGPDGVHSSHLWFGTHPHHIRDFFFLLQLYLSALCFFPSDF
jgi:hypothetical protein